MPSSAKLDRKMLLSRLEPIEPDKEDLEGQKGQEMSLASSLLVLARITPEKVWELCHSTAKHLLKKVPNPEDIDEMEE